MAPQDSFIEDEDDTCPLCIEEFDLSDRNFRPCPCGYQICQFCFNNIKQNMNSLCPACRRPYDDKTIQWKVVTSEEIAEFRSNIQKNQKKRAAEQRQKEVQKREAEKENRKNLVGVRVVQKNLVYVTGLNPTVREDELLKTLRKQEFFGQYGNIQKISISNRKSPDGSPSLGIYVTFEKKDEAQRCIQAVNGSMNGERTLKAQLGTTKYCSAWLRHEQCTNRQCMFLHELGDEEDSYTRQDLSSMNSINTQRPLNGGSSRSASRQQSHPLPVHTISAAVSQPMARAVSKDGSENDDASALPSSANWARNPQVRSRRGSYATSGAASSPAVSLSLPVSGSAVRMMESPLLEVAVVASAKAVEAPKSKEPKTKKEKDALTNLFFSLVQAMEKCNLPPTFLLDGLSLDAHPPLFDPRGGEKRRALRDDDSRISAELEEHQSEARESSEGEPESSGSLALGGEPEDREQRRVDHSFDQRRGGPPPPLQRANTDSLFGSFTSNYLANANPGTIGNRSMTPQQPSYQRTPTSFADHPPPGIAPSQTLFQGQTHNRQSSRFGFGNEGAAGNGATIKLAANPRLMAQQSSMMPPSLHAQNGSYYAASMPGPPPGLKSTGTPPAMFGHGFGGSGFSGTPKDTRDTSQLLQEMIRNRGSASSQAHEAGKREYMFPSFLSQYPSSGSSSPVPAPGFSASLYGPPPGAFPDLGSKQRKKGKKHRHANTSSSGGSGLVDLADPSILQARLPHQQSNAGVGQGLFGGQAQGDDDLSALDEAASIVDALVSDEPSIPSFVSNPLGSPLRVATPSFPPGFGHIFGFPAPALPPPAPPGLGRPMTPVSAPPSAAQSALRPAVPLMPAESPLAKKAAGTVSGSAGGTIGAVGAKATESPLVRHATPLAVAASPVVAKKLLQDEDFPALDVPAKAAGPAAGHAALPTPSRKASGMAKTPAAKAVATEATPPPALPISAVPSRVATPVPETKKEKEQTEKTEKTEKREEKAEKKAAPPVNTAAARTTPVKATTADSSPADSVPSAEAFPSLPTPATAASTNAMWTPVMRGTPKTLRVVQGSASGKAVESAGPALHGPLGGATESARSRANRPSTPVSEIISDNASVLSASVPASRAGSPPPSRIGSAAVRTTTKSQQRKQRKQATKKEAATIASQPVPEQDEGEEIAPLMGRKKKQKKEKPIRVNTPEESAAAAKKAAREAAREAKEKEAKEAREAKEAKERERKDREEKKAKEAQRAEEAFKHIAREAARATTKSRGATNSAKKEDGGKAPAAASTKTTAKGKAAKGNHTAAAAATSISAETAKVIADTIEEEEVLQAGLDTAARLSGTERILAKTSAQTVRTRLTENDKKSDALSLYNVVQGMVTHGLLQSDKDLSVLFREDDMADTQVVSKTARIETTVGEALLRPDAIFNDDDRAALMADKVVHKEVDGVRLMATPNGDCVRNLTAVEEQRFLELQGRVAAMAATPLAYQHPRYEGTGGFSLISKRAVPSGPPGYFPPAAPALAGGGSAGVSSSQVDPVAKIQREEAVYWINQYVLPRLNVPQPADAPSWESLLGEPGAPPLAPGTAVPPWLPEMRHVFKQGKLAGMGGVGDLDVDSLDMDFSKLDLSKLDFSSVDLSGVDLSTLTNMANMAGLTVSGSGVAGPTGTSGMPAMPSIPPMSNMPLVPNMAGMADMADGVVAAANHRGGRGSGGPNEPEDLSQVVQPMSVEDAEASLALARKEAASMGMTLNLLIKKNRRLLSSPCLEPFARVLAGL